MGLSLASLEQELVEAGHEKLGRNLWRKGDAYLYLREGKLVDARGVSAEDARIFEVEVAKIPKTSKTAPTGPSPSGLERYAAKIANLNELSGEHYEKARAIVEKTDDALVEAEMRGEVLTQFVYKFPQGGREVVGLTYAGIREIAKTVGRIEMESCDIIDGAESYIVKCRAKLLDTGVAMFGVAEQAKFMDLKSGQKRRDETALQKAVSKSQRNALRALIPEVQAITLLKRWLAEAGKGKS